MPGCSSGELRFSHTFTVQADSNAFTNIPRSAIPWVGDRDDVILYRIETFLSAQARSSQSCEALAKSKSFEETAALHGFERSSLADYWRSSWTNSSQPQDYSSLGTWRENASLHLLLDASVERCDSVNKAIICEEAGCTRNEFVLRVKNRGLNINNGCGSNSIAFGITALLQFASVPSGDLRVLPTFYSDGVFSLLREEERLVCFAPGPGSKTRGKRLEMKLSGWNVDDKIIPVPDKF